VGEQRLSDAKVIVGLGNPGGAYEYTRHNLGFLVVERIVAQCGMKMRPCSFSQAVAAQGTHNGTTIHCVMPMTYMNNSGVAVAQYVKRHGIDPAALVVVCDDLNLSFGSLRIRAKGSDGGHNGLASISARLQTTEYARVRMGIGSPGSSKDAAEYVLAAFKSHERAALDDFVAQAAESCLVWVSEGITNAMQRYNRRNEDGKKA